VQSHSTIEAAVIFCIAYAVLGNSVVYYKLRLLGAKPSPIGSSYFNCLSSGLAPLPGLWRFALSTDIALLVAFLAGCWLVGTSA